MTEFLLRTSRAPSLVVVIEREGPTRVFANAGSEADLMALESWIYDSEPRRTIVDAALEDRAETGGAGRGRRWARTLAAEGGGVVDALERLLEARG